MKNNNFEAHLPKATMNVIGPFFIQSTSFRTRSAFIGLDGDGQNQGPKFQEGYMPH